ncbi:MAG: hypothetical protein HQK54_00770 [Oligoflexales bacterium]|nr:hypothetical protein [Oligoflexales bacterium]
MRMILRSLKWFLSVLFVLGLSFLVINKGLLASTAYKKSTEGTEVVKNKIYTKSEAFEPNLNLGMILNQSYINTMLIDIGFNYFFSEGWGFGLDIGLGQNSDKPERACIENFYNDPNSELSVPCGGVENLEGKSRALYGPAYVPIREIQNIVLANAVWNPVYGKALVLLSATAYFDLFLEFGAGIASSKFYPKEEILKNGRKARGTFNEDGSQPTQKLGADKDQTFAYGTDGRPDPQSNTNILANIAIGQKFHFGKMFHIKAFVRNMTLLGTQDSFQNLTVLFAGFGMRF